MSYDSSKRNEIIVEETHATKSRWNKSMMEMGKKDQKQVKHGKEIEDKFDERIAVKFTLKCSSGEANFDK